MAARSQQGIRNVIQTLLSLLEDAGIPRIPSESFRKAKFNQPDVINTFWTILYHITELSNSIEHSKISFRLQIPSITKISLSVKRHLFRLGYNRTNFFKNPVCSRDLVLAFAWLLNKSELPNKLTQFYLRSANTATIPLKTGQTFLVEAMEKDIKLFGNEVEQIIKDISNYNPTGIDQLQITLKKLTWLKGRLECRFKSALTSQQGYQNLSDRIHRYTWRPSHNEHLSVHEVFLLRYPEQLSRYLQELEKHLLAIQRLSEWESCEGMFWQWMESVLDLEEKEAASCLDNGSDVLNNEELESKLVELEREVAKLIERNRPHIDKINRSWLTRSRSVGAAEIGAELSKITLTNNPTQIDAHSVKSTQENTTFIEQLNCMDQPLRLPPPEKASKKRNEKSYLLPSSKEQDHSDCLRALEHRLEQLQREVGVGKERMKVARTNVTRQLDNIEHTFPPSVCRL